jgi:hypothetical protein
MMLEILSSVDDEAIAEAVERDLVQPTEAYVNKLKEIAITQPASMKSSRVFVHFDEKNIKIERDHQNLLVEHLNHLIDQQNH